MIVAFALAVLAGYGAAALSRHPSGQIVLVAACAVAFLEGVA